MFSLLSFCLDNIPRGYESTHLLESLDNGASGALEIEVVSSRFINNIMFVVAFSKHFNIDIKVVIFNARQYHYAIYKPKLTLFIAGRVDVKPQGIEIVNPKVITNVGEVLPKFKKGVKKTSIYTHITMESLLSLNLPKTYLESLIDIFFPSLEFYKLYRKYNSLPPTHIKALKFCEILLYMYRLRRKRVEFDSKFQCSGEYLESFINSLPFKLTDDQLNAIDDIRKDLAGESAARRIVMGDVGCGKTMVILSSVMIAYPYRSILMLPTTILARQIYNEALKFLPSFVRVACVLSSGILGDIENADFLIGTQALLFLKTDFSRFALVMTDEQHRFGTNARKELEKMAQDEGGELSESTFSSSLAENLSFFDENLFSFLDTLDFCESVSTMEDLLDFESPAMLGKNGDLESAMFRSKTEISFELQKEVMLSDSETSLQNLDSKDSSPLAQNDELFRNDNSLVMLSDSETSIKSKQDSKDSSLSLRMTNLESQNDSTHHNDSNPVMLSVSEISHGSKTSHKSEITLDSKQNTESTKAQKSKKNPTSPDCKKQDSKAQHSTKKPHNIQLSATPIPRTMAMIESNFINFSFIKQMPFHKDITSIVINDYDFPALLEHIKSEISQGNQVAIIYPLIEESKDGRDNRIKYASLEQARAYWESRFESVFVTHGRDKAKEEVLASFANSSGAILLSTTMIEVGISIPNLTTIVISGAERLGFATLHQLRGRVSRNGLKGYCYLYTKMRDSKRLSDFCATSSGFDIAELDLRYRNSGDLLDGRVQSGNSFNFFNLLDDEDILKEARGFLDKTHI